MKRRLLIIGVLLLVGGSCAAVLIWMTQPNPARRPRAAIEAELWSLTPRGSSVEQVQAALRNHFGREGKLRYADLEDKFRSISLDYGHYMEPHNFPFATTVQCFWFFDHEEKLKEISVDLLVDGP